MNPFPITKFSHEFLGVLKISIDGRCGSAAECSVCQDEIGYARRAGEFWCRASDPCTVVTCTSDGTLV